MSSPKDLISKSVQRLQKPKPPTLRDMVVGDGSSEPLSPEKREAFRVEAVLAKRDNANSLASLEARKKAEADAEKARDDALIAAYERKRMEAIG